MSRSPKLSDSLKHCLIFEELEPQQIDELAGQCTCRTFKEGERLFPFGKTHKHFYVVRHGSIRFELKQFTHSSLLIGYTRENLFIGGWETLHKEPYPVSGVAVEDCSLIYIPREVFKKLFNNEASVLDVWLIILCTSKRCSTKRLKLIQFVTPKHVLCIPYFI